MNLLLKNYMFFLLLGMSWLGLINARKNMLIVLVCLELLLLSFMLLNMMCSYLTDTILGQNIALYMLTVAAAEAAVALSLLVIYYRYRGLLYLKNMSYLKS